MIDLGMKSSIPSKLYCLDARIGTNSLLLWDAKFMNEQMNILLEVLEEIKHQNRELKTSISNLVSQSISTTLSEEDSISPTDVAHLSGPKLR